MKKEWTQPVITSLGIKNTKSNPNAIIINIASEGPGNKYKWICDCCQTESTGTFATQADADKDFELNHKFSCPVFNYINGTCKIS